MTQQLCGGLHNGMVPQCASLHRLHALLRALPTPPSPSAPSCRGMSGFPGCSGQSPMQNHALRPLPRSGVRCLSTNGSSPGVFSPTAWPPLPPRNKDGMSVTTIPPPPPLNTDIPAWTDERWASPLDARRRIFCNRSLNMKQISAVGFDMDYTLAQYKPEMFETLAHRLTIQKLVTVFGYPEVLYDFTFDWRYMMRGLTIDKQRGNVIKLDRHKYVKIAYHGFRQLSRERRIETYNAGRVRLSFEEPDFAMIDTLFSLAEAFLFMQLVELQDSQPQLLPQGKSYTDLYRDVRAAVDLCHRDGSLKQEVAGDPGKYIHDDPRLLPTLEMLRASGRKVFLATNSLWDYTNCVMNWVLAKRAGSARSHEWLQHFDVVVTGCGKPAFFSQSKPLFEVHVPTGMLYNTENGSPMVPIGEADLPTLEMGSTAPSDVALAAWQPGQRARVFQGGTYLDLHKMLAVTSGSQVAYVGDHIYGDILRSKKTLGWRTILVVPELETELQILSRCKGNMEELKVLRQHREAMDDQLQRLEWLLAQRLADADADAGSGANGSGQGAEGGGAGAAAARDEERGAGGAGAWSSDDMDDEAEDEVAALLEAVDHLRQQRDEARVKHRDLLASHHAEFHRIWGQLLKTGYQMSQFAYQIERHACLYTSHVANMSFYGPNKSYKAPIDVMAHEVDGWFEVEGERSAVVAEIDML